jgi:hydrogenase maturation protein HypF
MIRKELIVQGKVQGVGFRPYVYKLANELNLEGFVLNNNIGVIIQIQGNKSLIKQFEKRLIDNLPILATIDNITTNDIDILYTGQFEIIQDTKNKSVHSPLNTVSILPDVSLCIDCKNDLKEKIKYKKYFATNCTNCGPRYSIIQTVPYDRNNTSMKDFILCNSCKDDYTNPLNRRYHAQPTSCVNCGLTLELHINNMPIITNQNQIYKTTSTLITDGKIGAIKGIGGFHIVCDATNSEVIQKLRLYKNRPTKPFAIMCKDIDTIKLLANVSNKEQEILHSIEAPIVILNKLNNNYISDEIAPNINKIGCILPYTALHHLLFENIKNPIVATSANISGEPIIMDIQNIKEHLPFVDFIVDYNRDIVNGCDDSVVQIVNDELNILRLSRGYTPYEIQLPFKLDKQILSIGANSKNNICLAFDKKIIISPYIGDLSNIKTFDFFNRTIDTFKRFYNVNYDVIVCDKHPSYESVKWAKQQKKELYEVQHHLAHIYAVKVEHNLIKKNYTAFSFDGTGYGDDKTLWGGEVFINDKRKYHFKQIKLLGATKAIKEPKRIALAILFDEYSLDEVLNLDLPTIKEFTKDEIKLLHQAYTKNINSPLTSSVGRLFDAIASFAGICQMQSYEGEAGLACEMGYNKLCKESFEFSLDNNIIDIKFDFYNKNIVSMFINTLINIIIKISLKHNQDIILSGGVFQNKTLLELLIKQLEKNNIKYFYNKIIPINDSSISLGQIWHYITNNDST